MPTTRVTIRTLFAIALAASGCTDAHRAKAGEQAYQTIDTNPTRDQETSKREYAAAAALLDQGKWPEAEAAIKRALTADVMNGPAHNALGHVYFHAGDYYLAAWEFQYASKLMPNQPEPRNNLGLVFEATGKLDDAIAAYQHAVEIEPDNAQFIGNEARARVRRGDDRAVVRPLLTRLIEIDTRRPWIDWSSDLIRKYDQSPAPQ